MVQQWFPMWACWKQSWFWLGSGWNLPNFGQQQCQVNMASPKSAWHSLHNIGRSLIWPIWRISNGPTAVVSYVRWLQPTLVLAWLWLNKSAKLWPAIVPRPREHACPKSARHSLHNIGRSLIGPIWRLSNGPAVRSGCKQPWLILAWLWLKSAKLWPATVPRGHGMSKISQTHSLHNMVTSLIGSIWKISNGPAVVCAGCKQSWFWLGSGWNLPNLWPATMPSEHGMSKISQT